MVPMKLIAKWIWKKQAVRNPYNQTVIARRSFHLEKFSNATIRITADSFYRLYINDQWVNDGPCRSYPEQYQYDELDVASYLKTGANEIKVVARYFGTGTFHQSPRHPGLLAQLDVTLRSGETETWITDGTWQVANAEPWLANTPKISIQMPPSEWYDARKESVLHFDEAAVLFECDQGPWKNLNPRDVALLTQIPLKPKSFLSASIVKKKEPGFCIPAIRLMHPNLIEANKNINSPFGMATLLTLEEDDLLTMDTDAFRADDFKIAIDGKHSPGGQYRLSKGTHFVLAFARNGFNHDREIFIRFSNPLDIKLGNPLDNGCENPWCFIPFSEYAFAGDDVRWSGFLENNPSARQKHDDYNSLTDQLLENIADKETFLFKLKDRAKNIPSEELFVRDSFWQFASRQPLKEGTKFVTHPDALLSEGGSVLITPCMQGDVELCYDLGEQNIGYYSFECTADAGVVVDIYGIEYVDKKGNIQHTNENRNGLRYITKEGLNQFTSLRRRSGRYIFITLRNIKNPVEIHLFELIESTYPVERIGGFRCNDGNLNKIWDISERTLKLCMEDVFTDCPLYEQTLWVGDARNESLFAYTTFGSTDIAGRCINLGAQSLAHFPIVGAQVPSSWNCILPAWSFLWSISVWDYYWYTGNVDFLRERYNSLIKNLKGAERFINEEGLFSGPFWNMFDWSGIDDGHETVLHNSMFLVGAINATLKCSEALNDKTQVQWLSDLRKSTCRALNKLWDNNAYPDSIHEDGSVSQSTSQHTSFLAILYDIIEKKNIPAAVKNMTAPPEKMTRVGSPFAMLYLYEAMEKLDLDDGIVESIYKNYIPMLNADATTVWETFANSTFDESVKLDDFPTRSHCHAWSSSPLYFLPRIILGIKQTAPGGKAFTINPNPYGLTHAKGSVATVNGSLSVEWSIRGGTLDLKYACPDGVRVRLL